MHTKSKTSTGMAMRMFLAISIFKLNLAALTKLVIESERTQRSEN